MCLWSLKTPLEIELTKEFLLSDFPTPQQQLRQVSWSPESDLLAVSVQGRIILLDMDTIKS